jgi:hypothetical protein
VRPYREVSMRQAVIVSVMLFTAGPAVAGQSATTPATARFGAQRPAPASPYRQLFEAQKALQSAIEETQASSSQPKVVCGMLIVPADPKIDPKIAVPSNKAPNLEFKIRVMEPPVCNPAK